MVVKLYYNTYICQLWSGDSNRISKKKVQKGGKRSNEGFRGIIILLYWPESSHALISPRCGVHLHTSHSILQPLFILKRWIEQALQSKTGRRICILTSRVAFISIVSLMPNSLILTYLNPFFAGNTKENYQPLGLVSVHYRNKALIKRYWV